MEVKLGKRWKNHPAGTILIANRGLIADLTKLDVLVKDEPESKAPVIPERHKMIGKAPAQKRKRKKKGGE